MEIVNIHYMENRRLPWEAFGKSCGNDMSIVEIRLSMKLKSFIKIYQRHHLQSMLMKSLHQRCYMDLNH